MLFVDSKEVIVDFGSSSDCFLLYLPCRDNADLWDVLMRAEAKISIGNERFAGFFTGGMPTDSTGLKFQYAYQ